MAPGIITRSAAACTITLAMDAAIPSTVTVTGPVWERNADAMAIPSHTFPPGLLTCTSRAPFTPASSPANAFAVIPSAKNPASPISSYTSTRVVVACAVIRAFSGCTSLTSHPFPGGVR
jgi:hypothetical protein